MAPPTHRTPLRRVSQGSLSALARSSGAGGATSLEFLEPVISDLADEADALHQNLEQLNALHQALDTFNESFASYLYALRMNAFCVEWNQGPADESFTRARDAAAATVALLARPNGPRPSTLGDSATATPGQDKSRADTTYATTAGSPIPSMIPNDTKATLSKVAKSKPKAPKKLSPAEKKKRDADIEKIVQSMPIEYRGNDPDLRRAIEAVIIKLMDSPLGLKIADLVKPPDLPQPRVNKCLIALVNKKMVKKTSQGGVTVYSYMGTQ